MSTNGGPTLGPCVSWIDGDAVAACCQIDPGSAGGAFFDEVAIEASMALYEISGRRFNGGCSALVRPCRDQCGCWSRAAGLGPYYWTTSMFGVAPGWGSGWWYNECGDRCGCGQIERVRLAGYPVTEIVEVKIDGVVLPFLDDDGNKNYRLDYRRELVRMDSPGPPVVKRHWPACQNLSLDDTEPGTFSVSYLWGVAPPSLARRAAAEVACQLMLQCSGAECLLPAGVTQVQRQGVTFNRELLLGWFDPTATTGLVSLDLFLKAYWPSRSGRRPVIYSPDVQQFPRPMQ